MKYEIVNLKEKTVAGVKGRTNNSAPDMGMVIGKLWSDFYEKGIYQAIEGKKNDKALGIYMDYESDEKGDYTLMVGCETANSEKVSDDISKTVIPAGKYAKFVVEGDMQKAAAAFWQELWTMKLPRSFVCDFEEYQNSDMEHACIHIYIGLKE